MNNRYFYVVGLLIAVLMGSCKKPAGLAHAWKLKNLDGRDVALSDFKGKVVVLDFWATWCAPCRSEMPDYVKLQEKYRGRDLVIVGISLDAQGPEVVKKFVGEFGINYPIVMATDDVTEAYKVQVIPTTFLIDREGKVRHEKTGPIKDLEEYEKRITALF